MDMIFLEMIPEKSLAVNINFLRIRGVSLSKTLCAGFYRNGPFIQQLPIPEKYEPDS